MIHVENALASARQALEEDRLEDAEGELRAVLEFDDFEPRALRLMGQVVRRRGDPQRAAEFYQKALKARGPEEAPAPQGPTPTPTLARLYTEQGHIEAAIEVYRQLLVDAGNDERAPEWRQRLAELEGGAGEAAAEPADGGASVDEPAATAPEPDDGEVDPELAEQRLRAFLDLLDGKPEAGRLRRFLERLDNRTAR